MTASVKYFCPQCQSMEIAIEDRGTLFVVKPSGLKAECKLCGWMGLRSDLHSAIAPQGESFWTGDRVANALLMSAAKHAAGPLILVLETIGLVPRVLGSEEARASAIHIREAVVKAMLEAVVVSAFETAGALTPEHYARFDADLVEPVERVFRYNEDSDDKS